MKHWNPVYDLSGEKVYFIHRNAHPGYVFSAHKSFIDRHPPSIIRLHYVCMNPRISQAYTFQQIMNMKDTFDDYNWNKLLKEIFNEV